MEKIHKIIYSDTVGCTERNHGPLLTDCDDIPNELRHALVHRFGLDCRLTPIQEEAIKAGIANRSNHFLVSAPTNSGKTLVGLFRIFTDVIQKRSRCVYVTPLKALAEEKRNELEELAAWIAECGGPKIRLSITTGDYQLTQEFLGSPPPKHGELVICTPERLETLLRSSDNLFWARAVSSFVLDEFHLLGDHRRGPTMEILITRILVSCPWSRIIALSATMGGLEAVKTWLAKGGTDVTVLESAWRYPILNRSVVSTSDKDAYVKELVNIIISEPDRSLLIFVSKKKDAENLVKNLQKAFPEHNKAITFLHAGLTWKERRERLKGLYEGKNRIVVATTALKMGIDAPVTNVIIRDLYLWGKRKSKFLTTADLLQMTGRAGRRDTPGDAVIIGDTDQSSRIAQMLRSGGVDPIEPQLVGIKKEQTEQPDPVLKILLTEIVMQGRVTISNLARYLAHTFSGSAGCSVDCLRQTNELVRLKLAYRKDEDPEHIFPSKLGKTVSLSGLSPESGAMIAGFLRALIKLDEKYEKRKGRRFSYLKRLTDLDLIFLCCATYECRECLLAIPGKKAIADIQEFLETLPPEEKPIVNLWFDETSTEYPTRRLLTTLRMFYNADKKGYTEKVYYRLMRTSILLYQHARGAPLARLAVKFKAHQGELENNLKYSILWVLSCFSQICNRKLCYKFDFLMMRALKLIECIAVGSELGELLTIKGIGRRSVQKLIDNGINSIDDLGDYSVPKLLKLGIGERQSKLINKWVRRQLR